MCYIQGCAINTLSCQSENSWLTPRMNLHYLLLLLLLILYVVPSQEHNHSKIHDPVESYENRKSQNEDLVPNNDSIQMYVVNTENKSFELINNTRTRGVHLQGSNTEKCTIRHKSTSPVVTPADLSHLWVSWDWDWFHTHQCSWPWIWSCECDPENQMLVVVDGLQQKIQLTNKKQRFAFVKADPCRKHNISLRVFSDSEETDLTEYDPRSFRKVTWMKKCQEDRNKTNITIIGNSIKDLEKRKDVAATIAIPVTCVALILVGFIGFVYFKRQKRNQRSGTETEDVNPMYGEYEQYGENGELRQNTMEVIDSSPYYGESCEDWEGAMITDSNEYYQL